MQKHLVKRGLISLNDSSIYTITDRLDVAYRTINNFYQVYHSSRYVKDKFVIRLKSELSDANMEQLNTEFSDILLKGYIVKSQAFPQEAGDETATNLPRLVFYFNQKDLGRLYQLIARINQMGASSPAAVHPEQK